MKISSEHLHSQIVRARELKIEKRFPSPTCLVSHVMCHVSCIRCPVLRVTCNKVLDKVVKLVGGGYVINQATPSSFNKGLFSNILQKNKNSNQYLGQKCKQLQIKKLPPKLNNGFLSFVVGRLLTGLSWVSFKQYASAWSLPFYYCSHFVPISLSLGIQNLICIFDSTKNTKFLFQNIFRHFWLLSTVFSKIDLFKKCMFLRFINSTRNC